MVWCGYFEALTTIEFFFIFENDSTNLAFRQRKLLAFYTSDFGIHVENFDALFYLQLFVVSAVF